MKIVRKGMGIVSFLLLLMILFCCTMAIMPVEAQRPNTSREGVSLSTTQFRWDTAATWLSANGAATTPSVTQRTYLTVLAAIAADANNQAEIRLYNIPSGANGMRFRAIGITDGQSLVVDVLAGSRAGNTDCAFSLMGTLTFTIGTQLSDTATYEFADTLVVTADSGTTATWTTASPADNSVAETRIDLMGADMLVLVPTTIGVNSKLLVKWY